MAALTACLEVARYINNDSPFTRVARSGAAIRYVFSCSKD